jgi:beta-barrel assembly-enhancing protease
MRSTTISGMRRRAGVLAFAGTVAVGVGACAPAVTTQDEVQLGREYANQIARELPLVQDRAVNQYINQLGNQIARRADPRGIQYTFYVVNAPEVNAFAVPGGHIYINRGLIERAANVSELAGVLAHEVAHVTHRHGIEQWRRAQQANMGLSVLYGVLLGRAPSGLEQAAVQVGGTAVFAGYSRDAEREADMTAISYLINSGIHPQGLVTMFERLMAERQRNPGQVEQWFATHPTTEERIANTRNAINSIPASSMAGLTTNSQAFADFRGRVRGLPASARR